MYNETHSKEWFRIRLLDERMNPEAKLHEKLEDNLRTLELLQQRYLELQKYEQVNGGYDRGSRTRIEMVSIAEEQIRLEEENEFIVWTLNGHSTHYLRNRVHRAEQLETDSQTRFLPDEERMFDE